MDNSSLIKSPISEELEDFKKLFESTLSSSNLLLNSVIAHIRQKNGKMMRPILVLLAAKLFGKVCPATLHAAVALELLHNASLVHDDVVDESTERRGQLSVNAIFNNKVAVLAGDYLLATALVQVGMTRNLLAAKLFGKVCPATLHAAVALELLHNASLVHDDVVDESTERRGQLSVNAIFNNKVAVLAGDYLLATALVQVGMTRNHDIIDIVSCLGQDLADGELLQLSNVSNLHFSEEVYFDVIRKKTAVLFAACTKAGALSVGASDEKAESARLFGEYIGLCFQIKDDIFDYSESKEIGKPTGNDMVEGKLTLPALHVLNTVKDKTAEEIAVKIKNGEATPGEIAHLIEFTKQNGGIEYASQVMYDYKEKALSLLASLPDTEVKAALAGYLDYVVEREK